MHLSVCVFGVNSKGKLDFKGYGSFDLFVSVEG